MIDLDASSGEKAARDQTFERAECIAIESEERLPSQEDTPAKRFKQAQESQAPFTVAEGTVKAVSQSVIWFQLETWKLPTNYVIKSGKKEITFDKFLRFLLREYKQTIFSEMSNIQLTLPAAVLDPNGKQDFASLQNHV